MLFTTLAPNHPQPSNGNKLMIDTHAHLYSEEFDNDRREMIQRALDNGVKKFILPNVDSQSLSRMLELEADYPGICHAAIGVHPTSIDQNYQQELSIVKSELDHRKYIAIGEIGIDLYWDKTYFAEQEVAFRQQLDWSLEYNLPVIIHVRDSFNETMEILSDYKGQGLRGIFHSFTGNKEQALSVIEFGGFYLGINGIVTFKNSGLSEIVKELNLDHLVLETDAPYLSPVPYRGKRNESAYLKLILQKIAEVKGCTEAEIKLKTTQNANMLFGL